MRLHNKAYEVLKTLIPQAMDRSKPLVDFRLIVELHLRLSENYFSREDYRNSMKCLKYIDAEYYSNEKVFSSGIVPLRLQYADHQCRLAGVYRKTSKFEKA